MTEQDFLYPLLDAVYHRPPANEAPRLAESRQKTATALRIALTEQTYAYDGFQWSIAHALWFAVGARGLVAVQMGDLSENAFIDYQTARLGKPLQRDAALTNPIKQQLWEYVQGERAAFDLTIDWSQMTPFQAKVLQQALHIPRGQVLTYSHLAAQIGSPKSARAVGRALGTNPMPIVIPCHRVIAASGDLTGYIGGLAVKAHLLNLEGYPVNR